MNKSYNYLLIGILVENSAGWLRYVFEKRCHSPGAQPPSHLTQHLIPDPTRLQTPMVELPRLPRSFFNRSTLQVARDLLGARLIRVEDGARIGGVIIEAEAYRGEEDLGCHAKAGRTPRTQIMYGPPGHAYVYFTYGVHWMLNFVTEEEGFPAAVLIRAIQPTEGVQIIASRRDNQPRQHWTDGPAKICQALAIDGGFNGRDLCAPDAQLFVESGSPIPDQSVTTGPRVGFNNVPEPWLSIPWRFRVVPEYITTESAENTEKK